MKPITQRPTKAQPIIGWSLEMVLDASHELFRLAGVIDWAAMDAEFGKLYCSDNGRPGIPIRRMAGLQLIKHTYGLSDEETLRRWVENPYYQFFCGEEYFQHELPINPSQMSKWRKRIGERGCEKLLELTIDAGKRTKTITERSVEKVIVDTTVQPKAVAHPTDARQYRKVHATMVHIANLEALELRQSYTRTVRNTFSQHARYAKAKQFKRARKAQKSLKTLAGRVMRDVERKLSDEAYARHKGKLLLAELLLTQKRKTKGKLYSLHAPEVECIAKGKAHKPYEFGVKVSLAVTHREGFCVGIQSCPENPYDGHTLEGQLDQVERLTGRAPKLAFVDKGYKGHGVPEARTKVLISGTRKLSPTLKRQLRRRSAVEPEIGHMKTDGHLGRNFLKGMAGDAMNALLCGAGHNLRKILARLRALLRLLSGEARAAAEGLLTRLAVLKQFSAALSALPEAA